MRVDVKTIVDDIDGREEDVVALLTKEEDGSLAIRYLLRNSEEIHQIVISENEEVEYSRTKPLKDQYEVRLMEISTCCNKPGEDEFALNRPIEPPYTYGDFLNDTAIKEPKQPLYNHGYVRPDRIGEQFIHPGSIHTTQEMPLYRHNTQQQIPEPYTPPEFAPLPPYTPPVFAPQLPNTVLPQQMPPLSRAASLFGPGSIPPESSDTSAQRGVPELLKTSEFETLEEFGDVVMKNLDETTDKLIQFIKSTLLLHCGEDVIVGSRRKGQHYSIIENHIPKGTQPMFMERVESIWGISGFRLMINNKITVMDQQTQRTRTLYSGHVMNDPDKVVLNLEKPVNFRQPGEINNTHFVQRGF